VNTKAKRVLVLMLGMECLLAPALANASSSEEAAPAVAPVDSTATPQPAAPLDLGNGPVYPPSAATESPDLRRFEARSTTAAVLMSVPLPGWGQLYGDAPFWGVVAFGAQMWFYGNITMQLRRQERQRVSRDQAPPGSAEREVRDALVTEHSERARDFIWWAAGSLLLVSLDAYVSVQLVDFDSPNPPTPDLERGLGAELPHGGVVAVTLQLPF
jgi:hypothetical protein